MNSEYIEQIGEAYRIAGSRVSLDSVVYGFLNGESPETIRENFPTLTLAQVFGALAFYLDNRAKMDEYIEQGELKFERLRERTRAANPHLTAKIEAARGQISRR